MTWNGDVFNDTTSNIHSQYFWSNTRVLYVLYNKTIMAGIFRTLGAWFTKRHLNGRQKTSFMSVSHFWFLTNKYQLTKQSNFSRLHLLYVTQFCMYHLSTVLATLNYTPFHILIWWNVIQGLWALQGECRCLWVSNLKPRSKNETCNHVKGCLNFWLFF